MGRKKWEAKNSKKKRSSYKNGLGKKKGSTQIQKKKGGILNRTEKMGSKELQEKKGHLTQMDWGKNWEANRSTKKLAS